MLLTLLAATTAFALELTPDNWDDKTAGKTVFLKFLAPWWGHCKKMKPAWDKLMTEFADSPSALVADVDCTADGKPLCDSNGVKGFPTIKYGNPTDLQDYQGGRDFDALLEFANENLGPTCAPDNLELCSDEKKAEIAKHIETGEEGLASKVAELEKQMADAEETFNTELKKLQNSYEKLQKDKEDAVSDAKGQGIGMMKSVLAFLKAGGGAAAESHDEL